MDNQLKKSCKLIFLGLVKKTPRSLISCFWQRNIMKFFLCVLGMVMIVEGLPYFAIPQKMKSWVQKVLEVPDNTLRWFGLVIMIIGLWLVYLGKR